MTNMKASVILRLTVCSAILLIFTSCEMGNESIIGSNPALNMSGCFGWKRTGLMNDEETGIYLKLEDACENHDIKTLNKILAISNNEIDLSCSPTKPRFIEPESPFIEISLKNTSNKNIHILETELMRFTANSYNRNDIWKDDFDVITARNPRYLKILKPSEVYRFTKELFVEGYGIHEIKLSISIGLWEKISEDTRRAHHSVIDRTSCQFYWGDEA